MSRYGITFSLALLASCAAAGSGDEPMDGPPKDTAPPDSPPMDTMPPYSCTSAATCPAATMLGTVSGDTGSQVLTAMGSQSAWYRVRVTEDYGGIDPIALSIGVKLTSPAGVDFDVFVYVNVNTDVASECTISYGTLTTNGADKTVRALWPDVGLSGDSRNVSIEVRPKAGSTCAMTKTWQLQITGNVP